MVTKPHWHGSGRPVLIVMVKAPVAGRVKTRLGAQFGMVNAAWWFRHQTRRLLRQLRDRRWEIVLAVDPDAEAWRARFWPADLARIPQGRGDLGQRMARALKTAGRRRVCLIGADIPGATRHHIARAFDALAGKEVVFGPATDGGFWLVGLRSGVQARRAMFAGVRWSGPHALSDCMARLAGWRIALADTLSDVDVAADLARTRPVSAG